LTPTAAAVFREDLRLVAPRHTIREAGRHALVAWVVLSFLAGVAVLFLLVLLVPGLTRLAGNCMAGAFWPKAGIGLLYLLAVPPLVLLLLVTLIGFPLGLFLLFLYLFSLLFAVPLTAATLVHWFEARRHARWRRGKVVLLALLLYAGLKLLLLIPVAGWLLVLIPLFPAFGALLTAGWILLRGNRTVT
jgi:hypothetical protein